MTKLVFSVKSQKILQEVCLNLNGSKLDLLDKSTKLKIGDIVSAVLESPFYNFELDSPSGRRFRRQANLAFCYIIYKSVVSIPPKSGNDKYINGCKNLQILLSPDNRQKVLLADAKSPVNTPLSRQSLNLSEFILKQIVNSNELIDLFVASDSVPILVNKLKTGTFYTLRKRFIAKSPSEIDSDNLLFCLINLASFPSENNIKYLISLIKISDSFLSTETITEYLLSVVDDFKKTNVIHFERIANELVKYIRGKLNTSQEGIQLKYLTSSYLSENAIDSKIIKSITFYAELVQNAYIILLLFSTDKLSDYYVGEAKNAIICSKTSTISFIYTFLMSFGYTSLFDSNDNPEQLPILRSNENSIFPVISLKQPVFYNGEVNDDDNDDDDNDDDDNDDDDADADDDDDDY